MKLHWYASHWAISCPMPFLSWKIIAITLFWIAGYERAKPEKFHPTVHFDFFSIRHVPAARFCKSFSFKIIMAGKMEWNEENANICELQLVKFSTYICFWFPLYSGGGVWEGIWNQTHLVVFNFCHHVSMYHDKARSNHWCQWPELSRTYRTVNFCNWYNGVWNLSESTCVQEFKYSSLKNNYIQYNFVNIASCI